jgi:hypothetical protein
MEDLVSAALDAIGLGGLQGANIQNYAIQS